MATKNTNGHEKSGQRAGGALSWISCFSWRNSSASHGRCEAEKPTVSLAEPSPAAIEKAAVAAFRERKDPVFTRS
jgi:hypothetical protein